jgi:hypothetical protein
MNPFFMAFEHRWEKGLNAFQQHEKQIFHIMLDKNLQSCSWTGIEREGKEIESECRGHFSCDIPSQRSFQEIRKV